jgi:preprotein translocase subunit SecG
MSAIAFQFDFSRNTETFLSHMMALFTPVLFLILCVLMVLRYDDMDSACLYFTTERKYRS